MNRASLEHVLLCCLAIHYAILILWFCLFFFRRAWLYRLHSRWFRISEPAFELLNYGGIGLYKILVLVFNLAPLLALWLTGS
ncbi:hypothetical protein KIF53_21830 [Chromobacterium subtsugae]|uniref:DUF6868 domain-containing protein n=1 Tax=Chromobacterium subtsugae TaxID=251747 RepID=A0ABS7FKM7_9NEIS|nr:MULTISPECIES: hypothetical protein [Chromobacterium]KUM03614.1 hypothetical protein Cv017_18625 [Chromobacterium subtsugae]KZE85399.1 hypothetical protein AWB61_19310 [Chromobacterium sp. F49]MBW7569172.1 hypothetical protein [Chromobacterium subtsugae]MBW8290281.1 hypothetical protein [Chromobacterium subtsugae]WSE92331.1 hypothetical protein U6115_03530 [Chromobacterium subtsugae]